MINQLQLPLDNHGGLVLGCPRIPKCPLYSPVCGTPENGRLTIVEILIYIFISSESSWKF